MRDTENGGAEVILSRSHPEFVAQLFAQEVPEINDGTITIERIVRDAGYRTKARCPISRSKSRSCRRLRRRPRHRVKNIIRELNNEKIDIIPYTEDPLQLLAKRTFPYRNQKDQCQ